MRKGLRINRFAIALAHEIATRLFPRVAVRPQNGLRQNGGDAMRYLGDGRPLQDEHVLWFWIIVGCISWIGVAVAVARLV
jgi:hypothetical protein